MDKRNPLENTTLRRFLTAGTANHESLSDYILFVQNGCGYCDWLLRELAAAKIKVPVLNIDDSKSNMGKWRKVTEGVHYTKPSLYNKKTGVVMPESEDILAYLKERFG